MDNEFTQMVSYAQNAEDVVLLRALSDLEHGFYVDIGAWHPTNDSITKAFYDRDWSGINVEPQPTYFKEFIEQRPRDINLQLAVSDSSGLLTLWVPHYSALATCRIEMLDASFPDYAEPKKYVVEAERLDKILHQYAKAREIHFLKIDVEGYEANVIAGADFDKCRPLVLIVEATSPHTNEPTWYDWESSLLAHGYLFALFDGLNRFYVREESREFLPKLAIPANCLDSFVTQREMKTRSKLAEARNRLKTLGIALPM
jgi:FkbM family methyltransferase